MPILQVDIPDPQKLIDAIHGKHENCQLNLNGAKKNAIRILQSFHHTLCGEIIGSFEPIKHLIYEPAFGEIGITEEMRQSFCNKDWLSITQGMLTNSWYGVFMGLRKIIEKEGKTKTSSITTITQKFKNLLSCHVNDDESIVPFLNDLENATRDLVIMRRDVIDPIADQFFAHLDTNAFDELDTFLPMFNSVQDCIELCESYYQIIYRFYLNTDYGLYGFKQKIALDLYRFLDALRISNEYSNNRDEIISIIFRNDKRPSKRNEEIAKRLMKIIEPSLNVR